MLSVLKYGKNYNTNKLTLCGLSFDIKPIDSIENIIITNGSIFNEIDTGKVYTFNDKSKFWMLQKGGEINDYVK
jgi:hypothetical protein